MATLNRFTFACYVNQDSSKLLFFLLLLCKSSIPFGKPFAKAFLFAFDRTGGFYQVKAHKKSRNALWQRQIGKFLCKNGQYSFPACYGMWYLCCLKHKSLPYFFAVRHFLKWNFVICFCNSIKNPSVSVSFYQSGRRKAIISRRAINRNLLSPLYRFDKASTYNYH